MVVALAAAACGADRDGEPLARSESADRPDAAAEATTQDAGSGDADPAEADPAEVEAFCAKAAELDQAAIDQAPEDAEAAAEARAQFDELLAVAPEAIRGDLQVLADVIDSMADLDQGDGPSSPEEAFEEMLSSVLSPGVIAAGVNLQAYLSEHCGIDMSSSGGFGLDGAVPGDPGGVAGDPSGGTTPEGGAAPSGGGADIGLEDLDAVEEAHLGEPWVDKVYSTSIVDDRQIQLIASDGTDGFGEPLTEEDAVDACEAVRTALEVRQPALSVEVLNGATVVVRGAAGAPCAVE
jgi:hypothetical protein